MIPVGISVQVHYTKSRGALVYDRSDGSPRSLFVEVERVVGFIFDWVGKKGGEERGGGRRKERKDNGHAWE